MYAVADQFRHVHNVRLLARVRPYLLLELIDSFLSKEKEIHSTVLGFRLKMCTQQDSLPAHPPSSPSPQTYARMCEQQKNFIQVTKLFQNFLIKF